MAANCYTPQTNCLAFKMAFALTIAALTAMCQADVYKTVTNDGQVVYTDTLNTAYQYNKNIKDNKNIKAIRVLDQLSTQTPASSSPGTAYATPTTVISQVDTPTNTTANTLTVQSLNPSSTGDYRVKILSPQSGQALRRGSQSIDVTVTVTPALKMGDRIVYQLDNKTLATTKALSYRISTANLDPKPYTLTVAIENIVGETIAQTTREVYVLSNNSLYQQKRKAIAAEQQQADQPWYKKIKRFGQLPSSLNHDAKKL